MTTRQNSAERRCEYAAGVLDYVAGELPEAERVRFESHVAGCAVCEEELDALKNVVRRLKSEPERPIMRDLTPVIMARLEAADMDNVTSSMLLERRALVNPPERHSVPLQRSFRTASWWMPRVAAAAAAVLILLGAIRFLGSFRKAMDHTQGGGPPASVSVAAHDGVITGPEPGMPEVQDWLRRTQEPDGSWSTARWGGNKRFEVALAGLSLLALLEGENGRASPALEDAAKKAADYLISQQAADGSFGPVFDGAPYNQGIATLALLRAQQRLRLTGAKPVIDRALAVIQSRQEQDGGWGYLGETPPAASISITLWQVQPLRVAFAMGWADVKPAMERGLRWAAEAKDDTGAFAYRDAGSPWSVARVPTSVGAVTLFDRAHGSLLSPARRRALLSRMDEMESNVAPDVDYYRRYFLTVAEHKMQESDARSRLAFDRVERRGSGGDAGRESSSLQASCSCLHSR